MAINNVNNFPEGMSEGHKHFLAALERAAAEASITTEALSTFMLYDLTQLWATSLRMRHVLEVNDAGLAGIFGRVAEFMAMES